MSYRITRRNEAFSFDAPGQFKVLSTRLHSPEDVGAGLLSVTLSHFLPGGGCEYGPSTGESLLYVVSGEITLRYESGETVLKEGDSFHCSAGSCKALFNHSCDTCKVLSCLIADPYGPAGSRAPSVFRT